MKQLEVVAAVIIQDQRVFAAQRNNTGETARLWEFPGGKIEAGESHAAALERELLEELGIVSRTGNFVLTVHHNYQTFALTMHCYLSTIISGTLQLHEHVNARWLSLGELNNVDWAPADQPVLEPVRQLLVN